MVVEGGGEGTVDLHAFPPELPSQIAHVLLTKVLAAAGVVFDTLGGV